LFKLVIATLDGVACGLHLLPIFLGQSITFVLRQFDLKQYQTILKGCPFLANDVGRAHDHLRLQFTHPVRNVLQAIENAVFCAGLVQFAHPVGQVLKALLGLKIKNNQTHHDKKQDEYDSNSKIIHTGFHFSSFKRHTSTC